LVLIVWLPAIAGFGLLAWSTYARETGAAQQHVQQLAQSLNSLVERELDKRSVMARTLGASTALAAEIHEPTQRHFRSSSAKALRHCERSGRA
jgi:hypothetical protein